MLIKYTVLKLPKVDFLSQLFNEWGGGASIDKKDNLYQAETLFKNQP